VLRDVGQGLRNVGGNIRDGITGFSGSVMSKPREFAHLIKNKFGSADNINQMSEAELQGMQSANADVLGSERLQQVPGAGTSTGSGGGGQNNNTGGAGSGTGKFNSDNGSECSSVTASKNLPNTPLTPIIRNVFTSSASTSLQTAMYESKSKSIAHF